MARYVRRLQVSRSHSASHRKSVRNHGVITRFIAVLAALALSLLVTGCSQARECSEVFNAVRCQVMTDYEARELGTTREQVASLVVLPQPTPETINGVTILQTRSGGPPVDVEVTLRDGSVHRVDLHCVGIPGIQCRDDPQLEAGSMMHGGYYDGTEAQLLGAGRPSLRTRSQTRCRSVSLAWTSPSITQADTGSRSARLGCPTAS
jgi:hypothetical protein